MAVYIAHTDARPGLFKVGISVSPDNRCIGLKSECKGAVLMPVRIWLDERDARDLERKTHHVLERMGIHAHGEWFRGNPNVGMWGVYQALKHTWGNYDLVETRARSQPLLEWGVGYMWSQKRIVRRWDKINALLAATEHRSATPK